LHHFGQRRRLNRGFKAFNEGIRSARGRVTRPSFQSISAVGHEIDFYNNRICGRHARRNAVGGRLKW